MSFTNEVRNQLGFYVYGLIDPLTDEIFYVGKANGNNRAFDHLRASEKESDKKKRIQSIIEQGSEVRIDILRFGLESEAVALEVEAAIIDAIGIENLTNQVRGHHIERGRFDSQQVKRTFGAQECYVSETGERAIAFFIKRTYYPNIRNSELYDATRQYWRIGEKARAINEDGEYDYAVAYAIVDSVVVAVFSIAQWFDAGSTMSTREDRPGEVYERELPKYEFVGNMIPDHELLNVRLLNDDGQPIPAQQIGFAYLN